jgi:hypothetical protein
MRYWCSSSYSRGLMVYRSAVRVMGSIGRLGRPFESVDERLSSLAGRGESILAPGRRGGYSVDMYCVEVERRLRYICVDDVLIGNLALGGLGNEPRQVNLMHVKVYTSRRTTCCTHFIMYSQAELSHRLKEITIKIML